MKYTSLLPGILTLVFLLPDVDARAQSIGNCATGGADENLSVNNVRARVVNTGGLFYRGEPHVYNVPKAEQGNAIFSAGIWIGGMVENQLRMAATRYGPWEFWPGPVEAALAGENCADYDRIYRVGIRDILALDDGGAASADISDWPWELGAPVIDGDGNPNNYNLSGGDRPEVLGHESLFWIMNDVGNTHQASGGVPLGMEVHVTAFAATSETESVDNSTLYRYRLIYKGATPLEEAYFAFFIDPDLGDASDDFVGSDSTLSMGYTYNADDFDGGSEGYGTPPPAIATQFVYGPVADNDGVDNDDDGTTDEAGERLRMTSFVFYNNGGGVMEDPRTSADYYSYMQARWKDGLHITYGGDGRNFSTIPTNFMYSGNPATGDFWSEVNNDGAGTWNPPGDRRYVIATGPFDMLPGESEELLISVVWSRGADHLDSVRKLKEDVAELTDIVASGFDFPLPDPPSTAPVLISPGDGATNQPNVLPLLWETMRSVEYEFQLSRETQFSALEQEHSVDHSALTVNLESNTQYFWRVRTSNIAGFGPWSVAWSFTTTDYNLSNVRPIVDFIAVANAAGPLDPADGAAADWRAFPGTGRPSDRQQVGEGKWIIATGMSGGCPTANCGDYESFISRSIRNGWTNITPFDFEIRFTGESLHYDRYNGGGIVINDPLPFELWNIGADSPDDPSDDYRMIPIALDWDSDGWGLRNEDHQASGGSNDPSTDWFYWYNPEDTSPGTTGYDAWASNATSGGNPQDLLGPEVMARFVLFNWNGGDTTTEGPYNQLMPEPGTIFRIITQSVPPPLLSSPADGAVIFPGEQSFYWSALDGETQQLLVALDPDFNQVVVDTSGVSSGHFELLPAETTYFWKIISPTGGESAVWQFTISESGGPLPTSYNFTANVTVADAVGQTTLSYGMLPGASDGFDADLDQYAPPSPPVGSFDARLRNPADDFLIDIRSGTQQSVAWDLIYQAEAGDITISWDPTALPADGSFRMTDAIGGLIADFDMRLSDTYSPPSGINNLRIIFTGTASVDVFVSDGWNMLGVPLLPSDAHYRSLFINSIENTFFAFTGTYTTPDPADFTPGTGYWLRFATPETLTIEGTHIEMLSLDLAGGWNIVSPPNCSVPFDSVSDTGEILLPGTLFHFNGNYALAPSLEPGKGYWVRTSSGGSVTLDCAAVGAAKGASIAETVLKGFQVLMIQDANGSRQRLYYGGRLPRDTHPLAYSAPPTSPGASWQAVFEDGRYVAEAGTAVVLLERASYPLMLMLSEGESENPTRVEALSANGQVLEQLTFSNGQPVSVTNPEIVSLRLIGDGDGQPSDYALEQNYPNPFNPATTIRFALPEATDVTIEVFDVLGRRVATLLRTDAMKAGWHEIRFDAGRLASGLYLYQLRAGSFNKIRQLVVLK